MLKARRPMMTLVQTGLVGRLTILKANDDTVVQTGPAGRLTTLKANDDAMVQTGQVGRLTMLKARRPMRTPWCRQGRWEDLPH